MRRLVEVILGVNFTASAQNVRGYKCKVPGCNKCFQRGEHLKRHVRSIHTNEKRKLRRRCIPEPRR